MERMRSARKGEELPCEGYEHAIAENVSQLELHQLTYIQNYNRQIVFDRRGELAQEKLDEQERVGRSCGGSHTLMNMPSDEQGDAISRGRALTAKGRVSPTKKHFGILPNIPKPNTPTGN